MFNSAVTVGAGMAGATQIEESATKIQGSARGSSKEGGGGCETMEEEKQQEEEETS